MARLKRKLILLGVIFILAGCNNNLQMPNSASQNISAETVLDDYTFPIKPGMKEWKALSSFDEMIKACQVPESVLQKMSTKGLVETILNYPLKGHHKYHYHNTLQHGLFKFNGFQKLFKREDVITELLAEYREINAKIINRAKVANLRTKLVVELSFAQPDIIKKLTKTQRHELLMKYRAITAKPTNNAKLSKNYLNYKSIEKLHTKLYVMELLFAQPDIIEKLTKKQCRELLEKSYVRYRDDTRYNSLSGGLLCGRILEYQKYKPFMREIKKESKSSSQFTVEGFLREGHVTGGIVVIKIFTYVEQFLQDNKK